MKNIFTAALDGASDAIIAFINCKVGNLHGDGSPEGVVTANIGREYFDMTLPSSPRRYVKTTNNSNTGWV